MASLLMRAFSFSLFSISKRFRRKAAPRKFTLTKDQEEQFETMVYRGTPPSSRDNLSLKVRSPYSRNSSPTVHPSQESAILNNKGPADALRGHAADQESFVETFFGPSRESFEIQQQERAEAHAQHSALDASRPESLVLQHRSTISATAYPSEESRRRKMGVPTNFPLDPSSLVYEERLDAPQNGLLSIYLLLDVEITYLLPPDITWPTTVRYFPSNHFIRLDPYTAFIDLMDGIKALHANERIEPDGRYLRDMELTGVSANLPRWVLPIQKSAAGELGKKIPARVRLGPENWLAASNLLRRRGAKDVLVAHYRFQLEKARGRDKDVVMEVREGR